MITRTDDPRTHLYALLGAGWTLRAIAAHAGVHASALSRYHRGDDLPHVASAILRVDPNDYATRTTPVRHGEQAEPFVPRIGTVRRLQALMRLGWPAREINARLHALGIVDKRAAENLLAQPGRWVTRSRHDAVAKVYRDLCTTPGPSSRSRTRAEKAGYPGPMDWDDIDRDEAPEKPDELCTEDGCLAAAEWTYDGIYIEGRSVCSKHAKARRAS